MGRSHGTSLFCPECGASNRAWKTACFLCHHRLSGADAEKTIGAAHSPSVFPSPPPVIPYESAPTVFSPALTLRISSVVLVIMVLALCLGLWHEVPFVMVILAAAATPALLYTLIVAAKRTITGRPLTDFDGGVGTFLSALAGVLMIGVSAVIAFFITCFSLPGRLAPTWPEDLHIRIGYSSLAATAAAAVMLCVFFIRTTWRWCAQTLRNSRDR